MKTKLIASNRYLRSAAMRHESVRVSVASSSAIEGIHVAFKAAPAAHAGKTAVRATKLGADRRKSAIRITSRRSSAKSRR